MTSVPEHPIERPPLTPLQQHILALVLNGLTNREIGDRLDLTPGLVGVYVGRLTRLFGVASRSEVTVPATMPVDDPLALAEVRPAVVVILRESRRRGCSRCWRSSLYRWWRRRS